MNNGVQQKFVSCCEEVLVIMLPAHAIIGVRTDQS